MIRSILLSIILVIPSYSFAKKIQIIHLNDLHSYFDGHLDGRGGYSRIKSKIDELKAAASAQNIPSIVLDAGDWGEGTSYYMTKNGTNSFKALGLLGVDVTIVGNHDHMQGGAELARQIKSANIKTQILSANLIQTPEMNLKDLVKAKTVLDVDGSKIHIIGLSTAEPHFQAPLFPGLIVPPDVVVHPLAKASKKDGADLVIALTHIGTFYDKFIAKTSTNIDIIVGGHDHVRLDEVIYKKNRNGKDIPIVQTGSQGFAVGSLIVDIKSKTENEVVSYKLYDINTTIPENLPVKEFVEEAKEDRNQLFNGRWDEVVGFSEIDLSGYIEGKSPKSATCWGQHMAKLTKDSVGADIGLYLSNFTGLHIQAGPITYGNLVDNFNHFQDFGDQGWEISKFSIKGKALKIVLRGIMALKNTMGVNAHGFSFSSFTWPSSIPWIGGKTATFRYRINGKKINKDQIYTVSMPHEIGYVLKKLISKRAAKVFPNLEDSGKFYWPVMEDYVRNNSPIKCISTNQ